jgi:dihydroneopterin aldolase
MAPKQRPVIEPLRIADAAEGLRHVFVRDLVLECAIGVHAHEKGRTQRVRINVDLGVSEQEQSLNDRLENVVCYENVVKRIRAIVADGHINLVETLAERIASLCLQDPQCRSARVRIEKLDVFADAASVGVEIERFAPIRSRGRA